MRQGPNASHAYAGRLVLAPGPDGQIDHGELIPRGASPIPVVGQTTGRAINLLFEVGSGQTLYGVGTLEHELTQCHGTMGGPLVGPKPGDSGDWITCCCPGTNPQDPDCAQTPLCVSCATVSSGPCTLAACRIGCYGGAAEDLASCLAGCRIYPFCP